MTFKYPNSNGTSILKEFFQNMGITFVEDLSSKPDRFRAAKIGKTPHFKFIKLSVNEDSNEILEVEIQTLKHPSVHSILGAALKLPAITATGYFTHSNNIEYRFLIRDYIDGEVLCKHPELIGHLTQAYHTVMEKFKQEVTLRTQFNSSFQNHYSLENVLNELNQWVTNMGRISNWDGSHYKQTISQKIRAFRNVNLNADWKRSTCIIFRDIYCSHIFVKNSQLYVIDTEMMASGSLFIDFGHLYFSFNREDLHQEFEESIKQHFRTDIPNWRSLLEVGILYKCLGQLHHLAVAPEHDLGKEEARIRSVADITSNAIATECMELINKICE